MRSLHTRAVVLRRTNYGEADRVLQLLTPEGRRSVIARSARKEKSKLAGGIELFAVSDVVIGQGRGELSILTGARLIHFYRHILEDYDRMQAGYGVMKIVASVGETIDTPDWYDIFVEVLAALDVKTISLPLIWTWFYVRYAALVGYELGLRYDVNGAPLAAEKKYMYDAVERGFREHSSGVIGADHIKFLRLIATKPLQVLVQVGGVSQVVADCFVLTRDHAAI